MDITGCGFSRAGLLDRLRRAMVCNWFAIGQSCRELFNYFNEVSPLPSAQLVRFEREPNNGQVLGNIFRSGGKQQRIDIRRRQVDWRRDRCCGWHLELPNERDRERRPYLHRNVTRLVGLHGHVDGCDPIFAERKSDAARWQRERCADRRATRYSYG